MALLSSLRAVFPRRTLSRQLSFREDLRSSNRVSEQADLLGASPRAPTRLLARWGDSPGIRVTATGSSGEGRIRTFGAHPKKTRPTGLLYLVPGAIGRSATSPHHPQPSSHASLFASDGHEPQPEVRVEQMPCSNVSALDLVKRGRGVRPYPRGLCQKVGRIRVKELARRFFFGVVMGSIVAAIRARGPSPSAPSSREARGCESWQWCSPADE